MGVPAHHLSFVYQKRMVGGYTHPTTDLRVHRKKPAGESAGFWFVCGAMTADWDYFLS